jgi:hypothetical protein
MVRICFDKRPQATMHIEIAAPAAMMPEVAALEGLQDAGSGRCGSGRFHGSRAILTP